MWLPQEYELFTQANDHNSHLEYEAALVVSDQLLALVKNDACKYAYVLACRKAVALRHLGRLEEAETAFQQAYHIVQEAEAHALCAYVLNDWSAMRPHHEGEEMVRTALGWLQQATYTPDPERVLEADISYVSATFARYMQATNPGTARRLLDQAKRVLKRHAHGEYPRYEQAYFIVLLWNVRLPPEQSPLGLLEYAGHIGEAALEALRHGKIDVALRQLRRSR